jgi:hypothetical protein
MKTIALLLGTTLLALIATALVQSFLLRRIPRKSTEALKALFSSPAKFPYYHQATLELKRRGEDIAFTLPHFIDMALAGGVKEFLGTGCLQNHFAARLHEVDLVTRPMKEETRTRLLEIRNEIGETR